MIAGLAGALYVPQVGIINPGEFSPLSFDRSGCMGRARRQRVTLRGGFGCDRGKRWQRRFLQGFIQRRLFFLGAIFRHLDNLPSRGILGALKML